MYLNLTYLPKNLPTYLLRYMASQRMKVYFIDFFLSFKKHCHVQLMSHVIIKFLVTNVALN